jgi:hypothetical protein
VPYWTNYNTGATFDWGYAGGSGSTPYNMQAYAGQWIGIAAKTFDAGQTYSVTLGGSDSTGQCHYAMAGDVKWQWGG